MCVGPSASGTLFAPQQTLGTQDIEKRRRLAEATGIKSPFFAKAIKGLGADFLASLETTPGATAGASSSGAPVIRFGVPQIGGDALGLSSLVIPTNG